MNSASKELPAGPLVVFFFFTIAITWVLWLGAGAVAGKIATAAPAPPAGFIALLFLPGTFAPALVALGLTARTGGRAAVLALVHRLFLWRVGFRWYVFAVGYIAAIKLFAAVVIRVATGSWPGFGNVAWYLMLAATLFSTVVGGQAGEEIGWRGYALPRLASRYGLAWASVLLGVIWAAWHLPLFFLPGADLTGQSFPVYLLAVAAISVALAWLYWRTNGSLLLTMLMHAAINNTTGIVPGAQTTGRVLTLSSSPVGWLTVGLLWMMAGYFLVRMPGNALKYPTR